MKKNILLSLSLLIMSTIQLSAQCTSYPYLLDITGFTSGCAAGESGSICFVTDPLWWLPMGGNSPCEGYVIEIEFPTPNFIITNLGSFTSYYFSPSTRKLRYDPQFLSNGNTVGCLEGVLQIPNTTFTLRIVNPNNPNDMIGSPATFTLDNVIHIGIDNQYTHLSDWIQPNGPLPVGPDVIGQRVAVHGTVEVNVGNYNFIQDTYNGSPYSEIIMMPGARLEVPDGNTLGIRYANVHGCNGAKWDRINVQHGGKLEFKFSKVKDAEVAVELMNGATIELQDMDFIHNAIGIGSFGKTYKTIYLTSYTDPNHQTRFTDGNEGIHLEYVAPIVNLSAFFNFSNMSASGIYLDKTDFNGQFLNFIDCAVGIDASSQNEMLSLDQCHFIGGGTGINDNGSTELIVTRSNFGSLNHGITRASGLPGEHSLIENNLMYDCSTNVYGAVQPSSAEIQFNDFTASRNNVELSGIGFGDHAWSVQHNDNLAIIGQSSIKNSNVHYSSVNNGRVYRNLNVSSDARNFVVNGGFNNKIGENLATSSLASMTVFGSTVLDISCNHLSSPTALTIIDNCTGSTIRRNTMSGSGYNLSYGTDANNYAASDFQLLMGNVFDVSTLDGPKAINYSDENTAIDNYFTVGYFNTQGNEHFPFFISEYVDWFKKTGGQDNDNCENNVDGEVVKMLRSGANTNISLLNNNIGETYGPEVEFDTKLKLFRQLNQLQALEPLDAMQQAWFSTLSTAPVAKFIQFENAWKDALSLTASEQLSMEQHQDEVMSLRDEINSIAWQVIDEQTGVATVNEAKKATVEAKKAEMSQKLAELTFMLKGKQQNLENQLTSLSALNQAAGLQPTVSGQNLQAVNSLLIKRFSTEFLGFSEAEQQSLRTIANQCVGQGGEGVLQARAMLAELSSETAEYNDECIQAIGLREADKKNITNLPGSLVVMPNPFEDKTLVVLPKGHTFSSITICDMFGKRLGLYTIAPGQTKLELDAKNLTSGIYLLSAQGAQSQTIKFVVAK